VDAEARLHFLLHHVAMHVDETGQQQAAATHDIGILDRLVADLFYAAVFDPDGAIGDDAVAQDNFEFTQPHAFSLSFRSSVIFSENRVPLFGIMLWICCFKMDFPVDRPAHHHNPVGHRPDDTKIMGDQAMVIRRSRCSVFSVSSNLGGAQL
jgi:hypothetical protein